jgi:hypothetical protein
MTLRRTTVLLALCGVLGESIILRHELAECYPYKLLRYPPDYYFTAIGNVLLVVLPLLAMSLSALTLPTRPLALPWVLPLLTPLFSAFVVIAATVFQYGVSLPVGVHNFDDYSIRMVLTEYFLFCLLLATLGFILGGACSLVLARMAHLRARPLLSSPEDRSV